MIEDENIYYKFKEENMRKGTFIRISFLKTLSNFHILAVKVFFDAENYNLK